MEDATLLEPNYQKELFKIEITVCKNSSQFSVIKIDDNHEVSLFEILGSLEHVKQHYLFEQSYYNRMQHLKDKEKKLKEEQEVQESDTSKAK